MLDALRFVSGSIAKKDFIPEMTHFQIANGRITSYNGVVTLSSPIALNFDIRPNADQMAKAINACNAPRIVMHETETGRLSIKSGPFKVLVDCRTEYFDLLRNVPTGTPHRLQVPILPALRTLLPFISEDASRQWSRGILFKDYYAYATNNIILIEWGMGFLLPISFVLPRAAIMELIRIDEEPLTILSDDTSIMFYYSGDRFLKSQLINNTWPDVKSMLSDRHERSLLVRVPDDFWRALEQIEAFADARRGVKVEPHRVIADEASVEGGWWTDYLSEEGAHFNIDQLLKLKKLAVHMGIGAYPAPVAFTGDNIRGIIAGMR